MNRVRAHLISVIVLVMALLAPAGPAVAEGEAGFEVTRLEAVLKDEWYLLDADIDYRFSEQALEALANGVPLTLEVRLQVRRKGAWIWEKDLQDVRLRYQLRYQSLSEIYQVDDMQSGSQQSFVTRQSALAALGKIREFQAIESARLKAGTEYLVSLKTALDIEALPLPLRPMAYLTPAWNLSSEWKTWPLVP
ncbi:MAG: DUF4390 domain-containing protein [Sedimenticola sp.]